ncbi:IS66 family insertion sequence element accessory protein TnpB [Clostridiales bacterium VE202-28]|uniref:IS66 family insertion sequence element accessory protein TnpB n=1 Tax=Enterocloster sp. OA13 TaxID=2914161 RepID=UPI0009DF0045
MVDIFKIPCFHPCALQFIHERVCPEYTCNRRRTLIKILQWDGSGFWILMKRLDRDSFHWPDTPDELQKVTLKEIHWLCDGLSEYYGAARNNHYP